MNSSRTSLQVYSNDTIENSILEWIDSFAIDTVPNAFEDLYLGVSLYEVLNKVDTLYWPRSKLVPQP